MVACGGAAEAGIDTLLILVVHSLGFKINETEAGKNMVPVADANHEVKDCRDNYICCYEDIISWSGQDGDGIEASGSFERREENTAGLWYVSGYGKRDGGVKQ